MNLPCSTSQPCCPGEISPYTLNFRNQTFLIPIKVHSKTYLLDLFKLKSSKAYQKSPEELAEEYAKQPNLILIKKER